MKRRIVISLICLFAALAAIITYLLMTGERGISSRAQPTRSLDITRLDDSTAQGLGWDSSGLDAVFNHAATLSSDTLMIITKNETIGAFGDLKLPYNTHSMRKSFLSALVGQHVGSGPYQIRLDATLKELDIDDQPGSLSVLQKQATVHNLLISMSGVYHRAAADGGLIADNARRLGDRENEPGTIWAYNNWDYNVLTTIFETRTGLSVAEAFETGIAQSSKMKDFIIDNVSYISEPELSQHKSASFRMSARDLAIFGQIYLNRGRIQGQQVIPESWVGRITTEFAKTGRDDLRWGHGYLWWIPGPNTDLPAGSFWAWGLGNQALFVVPAWDTVIVHQADTTQFLERIIPMIENDGMQAEKAIKELIISCAKRANRKSEYCIEHRFVSRRELEKLISLIAGARL